MRALGMGVAALLLGGCGGIAFELISRDDGGVDAAFEGGHEDAWHVPRGLPQVVRPTEVTVLAVDAGSVTETSTLDASAAQEVETRDRAPAIEGGWPDSRCDADAAPTSNATPDAVADSGDSGEGDALADAPPPPTLCEIARNCAGGVRWVLPELGGARDVCGTFTHATLVMCGHLYRGPAPSGLSTAGCAAWEDLGIRTVLDLRTEDERAQRPTSECVARSSRVILAPISRMAYPSMLTATASLKAVFATLTDPGAYPVYVHCDRGIDRTGVVIALALLAIGSREPHVLGEYNRTADVGLAVDDASMMALFTTLEQRGGAAEYLATIGVEPGAILAARDVLERP